jgi:hypothetical protein
LNKCEIRGCVDQKRLPFKFFSNCLFSLNSVNTPLEVSPANSPKSILDFMSPGVIW